MGSTQSTWGFSSAQLKMKFLIVCLFAAAYAAPEAEAEADPAVFYGGYGYPYAYGGYGLTYGLPAVHTVVKAAEADGDAAVAEVKTVAAPGSDLCWLHWIPLCCCCLPPICLWCCWIPIRPRCLQLWCTHSCCHPRCCQEIC